MKKNKKLILIAGVAAVFAIAVIAVALVLLSGNSTARKIDEQLELAEQYLDELDYESAIAAYQAVLDIDPKSEEAYIGLAETYIAMGDYEAALKIIEEGLSAVNSKELEQLKYVEELLEETETIEQPFFEENFNEPIETEENGVFYAENKFFNVEGDFYEQDDINVIAYSGNGEIIMFTTYEGNKLYYIDNKLEPIEVSSSVVDFKVSFFGDYIAYVVCEGNSSNESVILYLYDVENNTSVEIDTGVSIQGICISSVGKVIAYQNDNVVCIGSIGEQKEIVDEKGGIPVAVSDDGESFYYINENLELCYFNGAEIKIIQKEVTGPIWLTPNVSEILFVKNGKTYFYTPEMDEAKKVINTELYDVIMPRNALDIWEAGPYYCSECGIMVKKASFRNSIWDSLEGIYWIDNEGADSIFISDFFGGYGYAYKYQETEAAQVLLFLSLPGIGNGNLCKGTKSNGGEWEFETLYDEGDLIGLIASEDLSKIYIVTEENELYYFKSDIEIEKISDNVVYGKWKFAFNETMQRVFYIEDGNLYCADTKFETIEKIEENVREVKPFLNGIIYSVEVDDYSIVYYMERVPIELYRKEILE